MQDITILNLDCRDLGGVECGFLCTDPPYSPRVHDGMVSMLGSAPGTRKRAAGFDPLSDSLRDYVAEQRPSGWTAIYTDVQGIGAWEAAVGRAVRTLPWPQDDGGDTDGGVVGGLPWIRWSQPQSSDDRPPSGCEWVVLGHAPGKMVWHGPRNLVQLSHKCLRGLGKHTTEKPLDQALDLVAWFSNPGDLVYDPCCGRGTTALACAILGRRFLGCETQAEEVRLGLARVDAWERGELLPRDEERLRRWETSVGYPGDHSNQTPWERFTGDYHTTLIKGRLAAWL